MIDAEERYLALYDAMLDASEGAEARSDGTRLQFDSGAWALSAISAIAGAIATGYLGRFGEDLSESTRAKLKQIVAKKKAKPTHQSGLAEIQILVEVRVDISISEASTLAERNLIAARLRELGIAEGRIEKIIETVTQAITATDHRVL
ncbi:hypothetical protein GCM10009554_38880 [Kribbella koreensis]|uniref:Uncharacterized protein n=1 Tax=Kribbella koreensis TaxID=57909 RepID=A0ABP4B8W1_9ACTN